MSARRRRGRPCRCPEEVLRRLVIDQRAGVTQRQMIAELNERGVTTPGGSSLWCRSHISRLLQTRAAQDIRDELWPS